MYWWFRLCKYPDFASVGLLFEINDDYIWLGHSFVRQGFLDDVKLEPPIKEWKKWDY